MQIEIKSPSWFGTTGDIQFAVRYLGVTLSCHAPLSGLNLFICLLAHSPVYFFNSLKTECSYLYGGIKKKVLHTKIQPPPQRLGR